MNKSDDIMTLSETTPVLKYDEKIVYLPGAPCRFSADGGYVQGCVMELFQRIMQINISKIASQDPGENSLLAIAIGALLTLIILNFIMYLIYIFLIT